MSKLNWSVFGFLIAIGANGAVQRCRQLGEEKGMDLRETAVVGGCISIAEAAILTLKKLVPMCVATVHMGDCPCGGPLNFRGSSEKKPQFIK